MLVEFSRILRLVKSSGFSRYKVDVSRNLRLVNPNRFPRFWFRVRVMSCGVLLLIIGGGK